MRHGSVDRGAVGRRPAVGDWFTRAGVAAAVPPTQLHDVHAGRRDGREAQRVQGLHQAHDLRRELLAELCRPYAVGLCRRPQTTGTRP